MVDNIKMFHQEIGCEICGWVRVTYYIVQRCAERLILMEFEKFIY